VARFMPLMSGQHTDHQYDRVMFGRLKKTVTVAALLTLLLIVDDGAASSNTALDLSGGTIENWMTGQTARIRITIDFRHPLDGASSAVDENGRFGALMLSEVPDDALTPVAVPSCERGEVMVSTTAASVGTGIWEVLGTDDQPIGLIEQATHPFAEVQHSPVEGDLQAVLIWANQAVSFVGTCTFPFSATTLDYDFRFVRGWNLLYQEVTAVEANRIVSVRLHTDEHTTPLPYFFRPKP
jgi:hypothetical protein